MSETIEEGVGAAGPEDEVVLGTERHLKWEALDGLEHALMWLSGLLLAAFTFATLIDVVTRTLGASVPWLQEAILGAFIWGIFIGGAVSVRRNQHFVVSTPARRFGGMGRLVVEGIVYLTMLVVCLCLACFGFVFFVRSFSIFSQPSGTPLAVITAAIPVAGGLMTLFTFERVINGLRNGFEGREEAESGEAGE
jgi:TRAP-type transport system small permease protein